MDNLATKLKALREDRGLTQDEVSKVTGIKRATLCGYETGVRNPKYAALIKLSSFYSVSIDYLVGLENEDTFTQEKAAAVLEIPSGTTLKALREAKGVSRTDLCKRFCLNYSGLVNYEAERGPYIARKKLKIIADYLLELPTPEPTTVSKNNQAPESLAELKPMIAEMVREEVRSYLSELLKGGIKS